LHRAAGHCALPLVGSYSSASGSRSRRRHHHHHWLLRAISRHRSVSLVLCAAPGWAAAAPRRCRLLTASALNNAQQLAREAGANDPAL